ncbi:MAG: hypothetical protein ACYTGN_02545 [Planctomycetota bacterium]|jgi:hypothetical protein
MRSITILLLITAAATAQAKPKPRPKQPAASELFYKAFWFEQAAGKPDEALKLYKRVLAEYADSAEAPRAVLGYARITHARGEDVSTLAMLLAQKYPAAKTEIVAVRRLSAARATAFDPVPHKGDSNFVLKLKDCYAQMGTAGAIGAADRGLLIESGRLAHPMLTYALRDNNYDRVYGAAGILVEQNREDAYALLTKALQDDDVMFKTGICHALRGHQIDEPGLARALVGIYAAASPNLRESVVDTMVSMTKVEGDVRKVAYGLLARAVNDKSESVRKAAIKADMPRDSAADAYIKARLARMEKGDTVFANYHWAALVRLADQPEHVPAVRRLLTRWRPNSYSFTHDKYNAAAARLLAEVSVDWFSSAPGSTAYSAIQSACRSTPAAAYYVLDRIVAAGETAAIRYAADGMRQAIYPNTSFSVPAASPSFAYKYRRYLGKRSDDLARSAVAASFSRDARQRDAGEGVAQIIGLGPSADRLLVEAIKAHPQSPKLPGLVFWKSTLETVGPARMAAVAALGKSRQDFNTFVSVGRRVYAQNAKADGFFRVVVPKSGPEVVADLNLLAKSEHSTIVAAKFLQADAKEWRWGTRRGPVWSARQMVRPCQQPEVLSLTLKATADSRSEVAETALVVAAGQKNKAGFEALVLGLNAPTPKLRNKARETLATRGAPGVDAVLEDAKRRGTDERKVALALAGVYGNQRHALFLRAQLNTRDWRWAEAWEPYLKLEPKAAVNLALTEATGKGHAQYRYHATRVLTKTTHAGRIPVFQRLLRGDTDTRTLELVVRTVADQYLIELGSDVLKQLRHPDAKVRDLATKAIERLKFYVEAQKALGAEK